MQGLIRRKYKIPVWFLPGVKRAGQPSILMKLPPELWRMVIEYLLPSTVKALSLASRTFRSLTFPILFRELVITQPLSTSTTQILKDKEHLKSRLQFYTSPRLVSYVRRCRLRSILNATMFGAFSRFADFLALDDLVFGCLPRLFNLDTFICEYTVLNDARMEMLGQLRQLRSLTMDHCIVKNTRLEGFSNVLHRLELLSVRSSTAFPSFLANLTVPATYLRKLQITVNELSFVSYLPFLHQCPALETLSILPMSFSTESISQQRTHSAEACSLPPFPFLKNYSGPSSFMRFLMRSSLSNMSLGDVAEFEVLREQIMMHAKHLRSLTIITLFWTPELLELVSALLQLEHLDIEVGAFVPLDPIRTRADLVHIITNLIVPPRLRSLRVATRLRGSILASVIEHDMQRLQEMKEQHDELRYLAVHASNFCFVSRNGRMEAIEKGLESYALD